MKRLDARPGDPPSRSADSQNERTHVSPEASAQTLEERCIDTIRFLAVDAVQKAKSGHPGMPMGAAAAAYTLFTRHLRFDPADPAWPDRDLSLIHISEPTRLGMISYAVFCLKKKKKQKK